jgi:hypothetical protein
LTVKEFLAQWQPWQEGQGHVLWEGSDPLDQAPFKFIDSREGPNGHLQLRYGSGPDDPLPFILTLTPQYVAHATGKTLAITLQDVGADEEGKDRRDCLGLCVLPPSTPRPIISVVIPHDARNVSVILVSDRVGLQLPRRRAGYGDDSALGSGINLPRDGRCLRRSAERHHRKMAR